MHAHIRRSAAVALAASAGVGLIAAAPTPVTGPDWASVRVGIPGATPAFSPGTFDYTRRESTRGAGCDIAVSVRTPAGITANLGNRPAASGQQGRRSVISAGQRLSVTLSSGADRRTYSVRCLPADFPVFTARGLSTAQWLISGESFTHNLPTYAYVLDANGTPVWWHDEASGRPDNVQLLDRQQLATLGIDAPYAFTWFVGDTPVVVTADGRRTEYGHLADRHDFVVTPRGTVLTIQKVVRPCATNLTACVDMRRYGGQRMGIVQDRRIVEYDSEGAVVWQWSTADHTSIQDSARWLLSDQFDTARVSNSWDVAHVNAVNDLGDAIVLSARHQDAIYKVDKASGDVTWKLGGTRTPQSLTVIGDARTIPLDGPHDAHVLPDGTISVYDNGALTRRPPRVIRFRIDEVARTATVVSVVTFWRVATSRALGSARLLDSGNWLVNWGQTGIVSEMAGTNQSVLTLVFKDESRYRVVPIEEGVVPADDLRAGMDAMYGSPR